MIKSKFTNLNKNVVITHLETVSFILLLLISNEIKLKLGVLFKTNLKVPNPSLKSYQAQILPPDSKHMLESPLSMLRIGRKLNNNI